MGRYFRDELMGVWVFIVYCISIDISVLINLCSYITMNLKYISDDKLTIGLGW